MTSFRARALFATVMAASAFAACGGNIAPVDEVDSLADGGTTLVDGGRVARDAGGRTKPDSGVTSTVDASVCIDIDVTEFDTSCNLDTDCIDVTAGELCSGYNCTCGGATISKTDEAKYDTLFDSIPPASGGDICSCPYFGSPHCVQNTCIFCPASDFGGTIPEGCPDAG